MHDGNNLFTSGCSGCCPFGCWGIHSTLDGLIYSGEIEEVLIVGVSNTNRRMEEYTYSVDPGYGGGKGDLYLDFLEKEVLDVVKSKYRIQTDSLSTIGSSLGGLISCYAGWTRPEIWKKVGCMRYDFHSFSFSFLFLKMGNHFLFYSFQALHFGGIMKIFLRIYYLQMMFHQVIFIWILEDLLIHIMKHLMYFLFFYFCPILIKQYSF